MAAWHVLAGKEGVEGTCILETCASRLTHCHCRESFKVMVTPVAVQGEEWGVPNYEFVTPFSLFCHRYM